MTELRPRPFQQVCVEKLASVRSRLVGDDMGLGKTVEGILLDKATREEVLRKATTVHDRLPTLVVAPLSVLSSWEDHFNDWQPRLKVAVIDRKNRTLFERTLEYHTHDVYIMHWDVVRLVPQLADRRWLHVIGDEIHRIGNRDAQVTQAFKRNIRTLYKTGLSGTPAQTRPQDLWSILNWLYPKTFSSYWRFFNYHVVHKYHTAGACQAEDCYKQHKNSYRELMGVAHEDELQEIMKPFYVRRLKEEVLKDLPAKYYTTITVDLDAKQRRAYNQMRDDMLAWIGKHEDEPLAAPVAIAKLVRLQQLSAAYANIETVPKRVKLSDGSYEDRQVEVVKLTEPSSKLDAVMDLLQDNPSKSFVVFSVSRQVIELLAKRLDKAKIAYGMLTGSTPQDARGNLVKDFQAGKLRVFIGTIAAGGVGLTLTAASTAIFIDCDWSPAKDRQAEDRLHRIGQTNAVQIVHIIARDTVDLGKLQHFEQSWDWLKRLLGDKDTLVDSMSKYKTFERVE